MNKKVILAVLTYIVMSIGAFVLVTVTTPPAPQTSVKAEEADGDKVKGEDVETPLAEEAKVLVGEVLSREDLKKRLGEWEKFEMSSNGCERGVYAGRFYYNGFTIFSRTYDKGETFTIVSINE